ncbi:hypothetical protein KCU81_g6349, partial [Aureobasidium melanogenum]|uniref:Uncharacterized protein n=1 Tax=Aureobasidium melanogenum (strain CBS 110374) TaxID=1043003 RepID=A0A074VLH5_AURM1
MSVYLPCSFSHLTEIAPFEPWPGYNELQLGHWRPTPAGVIDTMKKYPTKIPDGAVTHLRKLRISGLRQLYCNIFEALRQPVDYIAEEDITLEAVDSQAGRNKKRKVVVRRAGDPVLGWHLIASIQIGDIGQRRRLSSYFSMQNSSASPKARPTSTIHGELDVYGR